MKDFKNWLVEGQGCIPGDDDDKDKDKKPDGEEGDGKEPLKEDSNTTPAAAVDTPTNKKKDEELTEISKKTLGSYLGKAVQSYANHSVDKARHERDGEEIQRMDHNAPKPVKDALRTAGDASRKQSYKSDEGRIRRGQGIMKAIKKLQEGDEEGAMDEAFDRGTKTAEA